MKEKLEEWTLSDLRALHKQLIETCNGLYSFAECLPDDKTNIRLAINDALSGMCYVCCALSKHTLSDDETA